MHEERTWFDNPPKRKRGGRRKLYGAAAAAHRKRMRKSTRKRTRSHPAPRRKRHMARKLYGAAAKAHARRVARGGGRKRRSSPRRKTTTSHRRRSWRRSSRQSASRAGRVLRYRRSNPPMARGLIGSLMSGAIDGAFVLAGEAGVGFIASVVPFGQGGGAAGIAVQLASALALGWAGHKISPNAGKMILAGAFAKIERNFAKNLPVIGGYLGDGEGYYAVGAYPTMGAYPALPPASLSAYPGADSMGEADPVSGAEY